MDNNFTNENNGYQNPYEAPSPDEVSNENVNSSMNQNISPNVNPNVSQTGSYNANGYNSNGYNPNGYYSNNNMNGYNPNGYNPNMGYGMYQQPEKKNGFGIASLVIGILSLTICCCGGSLIGLLGIIFAIVAFVRKESSKGFAIAGLITSIIGFAIGIFFVWYFAVCYSVAAESVKELQEEGIFAEDYLENGDDEAYYALLYPMIYEAVCEELGIEPDNEQMLQYYNEMYGEYPLDGVVDGLSDFEYSAEDDPYYDFVGHVFEGNDGSMLYLNEDGSFTWYQDDSNHDDNYYNGYYNLYTQYDAEGRLTEELTEYGITKEELDEYYERNSHDCGVEDLVVLELYTTEMFADGEQKTEEDYNPAKHYYGFYYEGYYDAANMDSANYAGFTYQY